MADNTLVTTTRAYGLTAGRCIAGLMILLGFSEKSAVRAGLRLTFIRTLVNGRHHSWYWCGSEL